MNAEIDWPKIFRALPRGLTFSEVANRIGKPYQQTRNAIIKFGYRVTDGRKFSQNPKRKLRVEEADWTKSNMELANQFKVSRERVRFLRAQLGKPFVESRGRKSRIGNGYAQRHD